MCPSGGLDIQKKEHRNGLDPAEKVILPPIQGSQSSLPKRILHGVLCIIVVVLVLCLLPFLLPVSLIFRLYRSILIRKIQERHGEKVELVSSGDAVWLQDTKENRTIINTVQLMQGKGDIDAIRQKIMDSLLNPKDPDEPGKYLFPKVRQYPSQILHRYVWMEEENFDIKQHVFVFHRKVPATKQLLQDMIGEMASKPLPSTTSPWQMILIPANSEKPEDYAILVRVHHAIADGISMVKILLTHLVDRRPDIENFSKPRFGTSDKLLRAVKAIFEGPYLMIERFMYPADNHALHGLPLSGDKCLAWSEPIDLELIKRIKNRTSTTVNDVLVSCLSAAFGNYFQENSSDPPRDILAYIPVDLRNPKSKLTLDNQFVLVFLKLPTNDTDPVTVLDKTRRRMYDIKHSPEPLVNSLIIKYFMARLPNWLTRMTFDMFSRKCTMVLSNVPGYQSTLALAGDVIQGIIFWPPQRANVGLGVSILSYDGHVRIGIMSDRTLLCNPSKLVEEFVKQVNALATALKVD